MTNYFIPAASKLANDTRIDPQGFGFENKGTEALSFRQFMGVFSGSRQVNALRGVYGSDGVKRVVCTLRWECFGCYIEEGAFWGYYFTPIDSCKMVYGCTG